VRCANGRATVRWRRRIARPEIHPIENRLIGGQPGQLNPGGEVGARIGQWRDDTARVKTGCGVPLDHHPRRTVAAAPDHRAVALQVAGLHAVGELRPILDRRDHCRRQPRHQQPGTDNLHDPSATNVEIAHACSPEKGKLKHGIMNPA
jgi:hypothetical protein